MLNSGDPKLKAQWILWPGSQKYSRRHTNQLRDRKYTRSVAPDNRMPAGKLGGCEIPWKSRNTFGKWNGKRSIAALCVITEDSVFGYAYP